MMQTTSHPRRFVKAGEKLDDFARIEPYFRDLLDRDIDTVEALEKWLLDGSEVAACLGEERTDRYVKMTCHTDDAALEEAYLEFVEGVIPKCRPLWHQLNIKYTQSPVAARLPRERYAVLDRNTRSAVELYRDENVPLLTDEAKLAQEYQKVCGAMTVEYDGKEQTLQQMSIYLEDPDRDVRRQAWELVARRRLQDRDKIEDIYDAMLAVRGKLAVNADLPDYRAYAFIAYQRFDYTPDDCLRFHDAIERTAVPAARSMNERRRERLGVETLRPWDLSVDELGRPALRPFSTVEELCDICRRIFGKIDPRCAEQFADMEANNYLDLDSRKGKAPGGYQSTYDESRHPFIFMNAVGLHRDVETLLHEGGHSFHAYATRDEDLIEYRGAPIEFCEVASMSMELLAMDHFDEVLYRRRPRPRQTQTTRKRHQDLPLGRHHRRVSALDLHPSRPRSGRSRRLLARTRRALRRRRRLHRLRRRAPLPLAAATAPVRGAVLLRRVRHCPVGGASGLAKRQTRPQSRPHQVLRGPVQSADRSRCRRSSSPPASVSTSPTKPWPR